MGDDLPTEYDCIVIGTGMTESIIAAAASRIGKRVLHLDINEFYGGQWASFNFDGLQSWLNDCRKLECHPDTSTDKYSSTLQKDNEVAIKAGNQFSAFINIEENWFISDKLEESLDQLSLSKKTQTDPANKDLEESGVSKLQDESDKLDRDKSESEKIESNDANTIEEEANDGETKLEILESKYWTPAKIKGDQRKFNLDLAPKLLFARGSLVELLISSNIARYAEFRNVSRVLTCLDGLLESVPCSRADVFATRHVSVVEKRMLMKLLTVCMEFEKNEAEFEGFEEKTFLDYLKSKKLTPNLIHYVLYAISMSTNDTPCLVGVTRTQKFLNSLGRYGNTPFLWPMYGSGELPQCFCRLCAVFGGVYHLKRSAEALILTEDQQKCLGIISGGQRLESSQLVLGVGFAPPQFLKSTPARGISRAIFITDASILPAEKETLTLMQFPSLDGSKDPVTVIELGPSTNACPRGLYVVHMTCKQSDTARSDLDHVVEALLRHKTYEPATSSVASETRFTQTNAAVAEEAGPVTDPDEEKRDVSEKSSRPGKPQVLWSLYFNCHDTSECDFSANIPDNVFLCSGPDLDLDFEVAVAQARSVFSRMYPESEFLPRAPDPEEIVLDGDDTEPGPSFQGAAEAGDQVDDQAKQVQESEVVEEIVGQGDESVEG